MHQQYLNLFLKFYSKLLDKHRHSALLTHTLERYLNFACKEEEKAAKQREKEGSDYKSYRSGESTGGEFEKVKKLFYSTQIEVCMLFYFLLLKVKEREGQGGKAMGKAVERAKVEKVLGSEDKKRYTGKVNKLIEQLQFLEGKVSEGKPIDWLFLEVFKEFQAQAPLTAQLLSSPSSLQSRQSLKASDYSQLLRSLRVECCVFDYINRQSHTLGEGLRIFLGRRSDTYFILTQKQYQKACLHATSHSPSSPPFPSIPRQQPQGDARMKELKKYSANKFKQQFLSEMVKLRQGYESNTAVIASLFGFRDASEGARTGEECSQA